MTEVKIEISARHCHLSKKDLDVLFGVGYELKKIRDLSVPGNFAAEETVVFQTELGKLEGMRVIGPAREQTQVEISRSDAKQLGTNPPIRLSGELDDSAGGILLGPKGQVELKDGVIIARRHLHCDEKKAKELDSKDGDVVSVRMEGERAVTFHEVVVRVISGSKFVMHLDTDESNAAGLAGGNDWGMLG
ncbi:phosphate propanoyltransferase [Patescibacteria group bacterium]|nr:phosphate propanoyltransferase [Patescibacteria group bacterium]